MDNDDCDLYDVFDSDDDDDFVTDDIHDVEVDMRDYTANVDEDELEIFEDFDEEVLDNEIFDSGSETDDVIGIVRKRKLKSLRKENEKISKSFYVGQVFGTKQEVKDLIYSHSVETRRNLKFVKDEADRLRVKCVGELPNFEINEAGGLGESQQRLRWVNDSEDKGPLKKHVGGRGKKKNPTLDLCPWVLFVSIDKESNSWMVKTFIEEHVCIQSRSIKACTSTFLSKNLMDQIEENPTIPVRAVQEQFQRKFQVNISRMKAYRAKCKAINQLHGDYSSQYGLLRNYIEEIKSTNPGTTVKVEVEPPSNPDDATRRFKRIYICLGSLKNGFKAIGRDLLGLDGTFMKGPYPGQILIAVGVDNNNGIYPLSYAIVESECVSSWSWFLKLVREDLNLEANSSFTFMSDRQKGILQAISRVFPRAEHRYCLRHILHNMKESYNGKVYKDLLWKLATSTTVRQFEHFVKELKGINVDAHLWLSKISPEHWSRSHFSGRAKSDVLLNNMCEVMNSKIVDGRDKPIITALEFIMVYLMRRIVNVLHVIDRCEGPLTPTATTQFDLIKKAATNFSVIWNGGDHYQVTGPYGDQRVVDVNQKTCTCRRWEITGMPCKHAVATIWNMEIQDQNARLPETWIDPVYRLDTWKHVYSFKICPINRKSEWPQSTIPTILTPPTHHKQIGRPKKVRKKSATELEDLSRGGKLSKKNSIVKCGKCHNPGHNSRTCDGRGGQV